MGECSDGSKKSNCTLINFGTEDNFGHIGSSKGREQKSKHSYQLNSNYQPIVIDLSQLLEEFGGSKILEIHFKLRLGLKALIEFDEEGDGGEDVPEQQDDMGYSSDCFIVGKSCYHCNNCHIIQCIKQCCKYLSQQLKYF